MKALLAKYPLRRAVGLYVGEREVVLSRVAVTPMGPVEVDRQAEPRDDEKPLDDVLRRLVEPLAASRAWRRAPVGVGVPTLGVFFATRPVPRTADELSPQVLLHEILQSPNLVIDHMEVDALRWQPGRATLASVVACRKKALAPVLDALAACGVRPYRVEPAACALLRAAVARHRTPRRAATALRVFLGQGHALAVLTAADAPLMWRSFALEDGAEATAVLSTCRYIAESHRAYGADAPPAVVLLHGRSELAGLREAAEGGQFPARVLRFDDPGDEPGAVAPGLALGCLPPVEAFNLARDLRPPEPALKLLPWGQLTLQALALAGATWLMVDHRRGLEQSAAVVAAERAGFARLKDTPTAALRAERDDLRRRVGAIRQFLATRILWSACTGAIASRLPAEMTVTNLDGQCGYATGSRRGSTPPRRSLAVALEAPIPVGQAVPPEVEELLKALRAAPALQAELPAIEMAGLRWGVSGTTKAPTAAFTVTCQPTAPRGNARKPGG